MVEDTLVPYFIGAFKCDGNTAILLYPQFKQLVLYAQCSKCTNMTGGITISCLRSISTDPYDFFYRFLITKPLLEVVIPNFLTKVNDRNLFRYGDLLFDIQILIF